jgi:hypothetical protein
MISKNTFAGEEMFDGLIAVEGDETMADDDLDTTVGGLAPTADGAAVVVDATVSGGLAAVAGDETVVGGLEIGAGEINIGLATYH